MKKRFRSLSILILTLIFVLSVWGFAVTTARYVSSPSATIVDDSMSGSVNYSLTSALTVRTVDELKAAIQNGYSSIKIDDSVANPLFVSGDELEVKSDLILDLNGHEIQRNDRDPMLNVTAGVNLTIIDSNTLGGGSMYNPVGSVLNIEGGTLTTQAGTYESGPRKNEHYSVYTGDSSLKIYNNATGGNYAGGVITTTANVTVNINNHSNGELQSTTTGDYVMPVILPQKYTAANGTTTINGSLYIDSAYNSGNGYTTTTSGAYSGYTIANDTYLYVIMDGADSRYISTDGAQFSYSYYVSEDTTKTTSVKYNYVGTTSLSDDDILVTVYGYFYDKYLASDDSSSTNQQYLGRDISNFAAIKMQSGTFNVSNGNFYSYFGEYTSYCVSATGGTLKISSGTFEAIEEGVCVRSTASGSGSVTINGGKFYSFKGDMAQVVDGTITVNGGTFTKDATISYTGDVITTKTDYSSGVTADGENNSAIDLDGGTMTVTNAEIILNGSGVNGIKCQNGSTDGSVTISDSTFTYNESASSTYSNNVGIVNYGGTITAKDCLFTTSTYDSSSKGIKSESGEITANGCYFVLSGTQSTGIYAQGGTVDVGDASDVSSTICMFYIDHVDKCYGIYAANDTSTAITLNVNAAQFIMGQTGYKTENANVPAAYTSGSGDVFNGAGIYLNATNGALYLQRAVFLMAGNYTAGVLAEKGTITQTDTGNNGYTSAFLIGVEHTYYDGAGICNSSYTASFSENKFNKYYFVMQTSSYSAASGWYTLGTTNALSSLSNQFAGLEATGSAIGSYGIFSQGGTIMAANVYVVLCSTYGSGIYTSGGTMNIASFQCDVRSTDSSATTYPGGIATADVSSSAIASESGTNSSNASITIGTSTINTDAYGFNVKSGTLTFTGTNTLVSTRATAIYINGADLEIGSSASLTITSNIATQSGWNTKTYDTSIFLTDYNNLSYSNNNINTANSTTIQPDGIYVSGGSLNSYGTLNVTFSGVNNNTSVTYFVDFVMTSYAVRVVVPVGATESAEVAITKGAITSSVGGGVYVANSSASYNADVYLGVSDAANTGLTVKTTGSGTKSTNSVLTQYDSNRTITSTGSWGYYLYPASGHAVKVDSGNLTIYSGTYSAVQGNGIFVNGASSVVKIYEGNFTGNEVDNTGYVGPAISYGLKLFDGNMYVYGGTFGEDLSNSSSNGVFVMGSSTTSTSNPTGYDCNAYFYGGNYYGGTGRAMSLMGYCYTEIGTTDTSIYNGASPTIDGDVYGVGLEPFDNVASSSYVGTFKMCAGTITSNTDGIWIGNINYTVEIVGATVSGDTYGVNIYGGSDGIIFYQDRTYTKTITITNAKVYSGTYAINFYGYITANVTLTNSTIYGGSAIRSYGDPGSGVTFTISGCTIYSNTSWNAIELNSSWAAALTINNGSVLTGGSTSGTTYSTAYHSVRVDGALTGSITVDNSTVTSSLGYGIYVGGATSGSISVTNSATVSTTANSSYGIYVGGNFTGNITVGTNGSTTDASTVVGTYTAGNGMNRKTYSIYISNAYNTNATVAEYSTAYSGSTYLNVYVNTNKNNLQTTGTVGTN